MFLEARGGSRHVLFPFWERRHALARQAGTGKEAISFRSPCWVQAIAWLIKTGFIFKERAPEGAQKKS